MSKTLDPDDPRRFLDPHTVAKIDRLDLRAKQVVEGMLAGMHKSPFFGQSVEFVQHREYVQGDDIRHLDWKVQAKTGKYYVKLYEAETTFRAALVVDTSESMGYVNPQSAFTKYEYACTSAACLAHLIARQQDSVGLTSFGWDVKQALPPKSSQRHLNAIMQTMDRTRPGQKTNLFSCLRQVAETLPSRGVVLVFSDLLADREPIFKGLELLRHRRHDVSMFHILDDDELTFPFNGMTRFEGLEELPNLFCDPKALRDGYLDALEEYLTEVRRGCTRIGVDYHLIRTSDYMDAVLSRFLFRRMSDRANPVKK